MFACYRPLGPESDQKLAGKRLTHDTGVPAHSHPLRTHPAAARALGPRPHTRPLCSSLLESGSGLGFALCISYTLRLVSFPNDPTTTGQWAPSNPTAWWGLARTALPRRRSAYSTLTPVLSGAPALLGCPRLHITACPTRGAPAFLSLSLDHAPYSSRRVCRTGDEHDERSQEGRPAPRLYGGK